jgi:hypothetical protein
MPEENVVNLPGDPGAESSSQSADRRSTPNEALPKVNLGGFPIGDIRLQPLTAPIGNIFFLDYKYGVDYVDYDEKDPRPAPKCALERVAGPDFL